VQRSGHVVGVLRAPGFVRLLATRLTGQFGDGVFQASLAGTVLFNPERQASAADVAAAFAVLLLPYSVVGPFAGVLLDRWWRQRVLVVVNLARSVAVLAVAAEIAAGTAGIGFYASALVVLSFGRFILSGLSAALPRLVTGPELVTANAFTATAGTVATAAGGGAAIVVRSIIGSTDAQYALVAAAALVPFAAAAVVARGFARTALGPSEEERRGRETPAAVLRGLVSGAREIGRTRPVATVLLTIGVHRLGYGVWTVCTVLLYRNRFPDGGFFRGGLGGLGQVVVALAAGGALAALVTPTAFRRVGSGPWISAMLAASAAVALSCGLPYQKPLAVLGALLLGFAAQSAKISADTIVQRDTPDRLRGRVFTIYDMLFNLALVAAAAITAVALPEDGHSPSALAVLAVGWVVLAGAYLRSSRRTSV
jgi:MFS family permease